MNGIIVINKEREYTSFDVIAVVRKLLHVKKAGHTGTLDPNATGVLPVLLGSATKAQDIIPDHDKEYAAQFRLGIETDTLDIWGKILKEEKSEIKKSDIEAVLCEFTGNIIQIPPMYSSVSVNGRRLYDLARRGETVERPKREVTVYRLELLSFDEKTQSGKLCIRCSRGTYVRTLIDDMAKRLKTIGVMSALERTVACSYTIEESVTLGELKKAVDTGTYEKYIRPVESLFMVYDELTVSDAQSIRFRNGNPLDLCRTALRNDITDKKIYRVRDKNGVFLSLGIVDESSNQMKLYKHF